MLSITFALLATLAQSVPAQSTTQSVPPPAPVTTSSSASETESTPPPALPMTPRGTGKKAMNPPQHSVAPAQPAVSGPISIAVSTQKKILVVRVGGVDVKKYDVAVGTKTKPTPMGRFTIRHIVWNPGWHPPAEKWAKGKKPAPPGDPKNPMKVVKVFFQEPDYYIHGTDQEDSLGSAASHGCIRMSQDDVYSLARYLQDHAGAAKPESWYVSAINGTSSQSVQLPRGIPIVIGP